MGLFKKNTGAGKAPEAQTVVAAPAAPCTVDFELTAVIAAAIAAFEGGGKGAELTVRKINRIAGPVLAWNSAGRSECIDSRRI